jgi:hypothetical protein
MVFFRGSIWWLVASGLVGFYLGYRKGFAQWGLLLGLTLGPIGWGVILLLPSQPPRRFQGASGYSGPEAFSDSAGSREPPDAACPRCGKPAGGEKACAHCGNLLIPIQYKVTRARTGAAE